MKPNLDVWDYRFWISLSSSLPSLYDKRTKKQNPRPCSGVRRHRRRCRCALAPTPEAPLPSTSFSLCFLTHISLAVNMFASVVCLSPARILNLPGK